MKVVIQGRRMVIPLAPILAIGSVLILLLFSVRIGTVAASEVGILINNLSGNVEVITRPGSFVYNGIYQDLHAVEKTEKTLKMRAATGDDVRIKTLDGSDVQLDVEVNYTLLLDEKQIRETLLDESGVAKVAVVRRPTPRSRRSFETEEAYQAKWIRDYSRTVVRYVFGTLTAEEFYDAAKRDDKARETERELNKALQPHGIEVRKVTPDKFSFYEEYEEKIREKKKADQEVDVQKAEAKTAIQDQRRQEVEAQKAASVEIETIKGLLAKQLLTAEAGAVKVRLKAEADAYATRVGADAAFFKAERDAKAILAEAKAEAQGLTNLVKALAGPGGRNLVLRELAEAIRSARIEGQPYATSPVIQKLSVDGVDAKKGGGR